MTPQSLAPRDEAALAELMRQTFGGLCRIDACWVMAREVDYTVARLQLSQPELRVIVKLAGPMALRDSAFDRTAAICRLVRTHTTVPNGGVVAVDVTSQRWPWRYLIMTCLSGKTWAEVRPQLDGEQLRAAYQQIGEAVAALHNIPFTQFGEVVADGTVPFGSPYLQALYSRARRRIRDPRAAERFLALLQERAYLFADVAEPRLTHEDLHPSNILFTADEQGLPRLSGIVDFDSAWAGCCESDLARLEFWRGMVGPGFWEGYTSVRPVAQTYPQRRLLYQLLWCLEYARQTPQHIEDTRWVCEQLGVRPEVLLG